MTSSRIPTSRKTVPTMRSIPRRSRENQIAPAKAAIASRMTTQLSTLIVSTAVCAALS